MLGAAPGGGSVKFPCRSDCCASCSGAPLRHPASTTAKARMMTNALNALLINMPLFKNDPAPPRPDAPRTRTFYERFDEGVSADAYLTTTRPPTQNPPRDIQGIADAP